MNLTQYWIEWFSLLLKFKGHKANNHSFFTQSHWRNRCSRVSGALLQRQQSSNGRRNLLLKTVLDEIISQTNSQMRFLRQTWIFIFHKDFQSLVLKIEWLGRFEHSIALYADLTSNLLNGDKHQKT